MTDTVPTGPAPAGVRAWAGLAVIVLATMVIAADMTVLHLAVPHISADLAPSGMQQLWIVDIYGFVIAGLLITMGALGDRFGRRKMLLLGAGLFGLASTIAAFSTTATMLITARGLLGIAGAMMMPSTLALVRTMFVDPRQRGLAIGAWSAGFSGGATLGPVVGGVLLESFWWGAVFLMAVPIMALLVTLGPALLSEHRRAQPGRLDLLSAALWLLTMLATVYGLKRTAADGASTASLVAIAVGVALGVVFVRRQQQLTNPLLQLRLFCRRTFATPLVAIMIATLTFAGAQFFIGQHLQMLTGLSPLQAGLWLLPGAAVSTGSTLLSPLLARTIPKIRLIVAALALMTAGLGVLASITADSEPATVAFAFALMAIGFGPVLALGTDLATGSAPTDDAGAAAGVVSTNSDLSVSLGIALLGSIGAAATSRTSSLRMSPTVPPGPPRTPSAVPSPPRTNYPSTRRHCSSTRRVSPSPTVCRPSARSA